MHPSTIVRTVVLEMVHDEDILLHIVNSFKRMCTGAEGTFILQPNLFPGLEIICKVHADSNFVS